MMSRKYNTLLIEQLKLLAPQSLLGSQLYLGPLLLHQSKEGNAEKIKRLVSKGAPFYVDWDGSSCLHWAAHHNLTDVVELLLRCGISANSYNKVGRTPLHVAAQNGNYEIAKLLLAIKSDPNARDLLIMTPLHWACMSGNTDLVLLLLDHGALMSIRNKFGKLPAEIAEDYSHHEIVKLLEEMRALPSSEKTDRLLYARHESTSLAKAIRLNLPTSSSKNDILIYTEERKSLLINKQGLECKNRNRIWNTMSSSERHYAKFMATQINRYVNDEKADCTSEPSHAPNTEKLKHAEKRKESIQHNGDIRIKKLKLNGNHKMVAVISTENPDMQNKSAKITNDDNDGNADHSSKLTDVSNEEILEGVEEKNDLDLQNDENMEVNGNGKVMETSNMENLNTQNIIEKKTEHVHGYSSRQTNVPNEEKSKFVEDKNDLDLLNVDNMEVDGNGEVMEKSNVENLDAQNMIDKKTEDDQDDDGDYSAKQTNVLNEEAGSSELDSSKPTLNVPKSPAKVIQISKIGGSSSTSGFKSLPGKKIIQIKAEDLIYMTKEKKVVIKTAPAPFEFQGKQYSNQEDLASDIQTKLSNIQKQVETIKTLYRAKLIEIEELSAFYNEILTEPWPPTTNDVSRST